MKSIRFVRWISKIFIRSLRFLKKNGKTILESIRLWWNQNPSYNNLSLFPQFRSKAPYHSKRRKQNWVSAIWKGCFGIWSSLKNRIHPQRKNYHRLQHSGICNRIHPLSILRQIHWICPSRESKRKNRLW